MIEVPPGVLDPVLFRSGAWLAGEVATRMEPGQRLLDLGCGTGIIGLAATRAGATVVATGRSDRAVAAARHNGLADVRQGDLFGPVRRERFDRICFNPPYLAGRPWRWGGPWASLSLALHGGPGLDLARRFDVELDGHLAPGGRAWLCWSDRAAVAPPALLGPDWQERSAHREEGERLSLWEREARR